MRTHRGARGKRAGGSRMRRRGPVAGVLLGALLLTAAAGRAAGTGATITFREAVEIALARNTSLERAENDIILDRNAVSQARMQFLPDLRLGVSGSESYSKSSGKSTADDESGSDEGGSGSSWSESFSAGLSSSLTLFDGLANVAELRQAKLEADAGEEDFERKRQTVVFEVITGYLTMIEATEQVRVREENLIAQEELEASVRARVEAGEVAIADLYQQQAQVASARLALLQTRQALELSRIDLVGTLQLDPLGEYRFEIPRLPERDPGDRELQPRELLAQAFALRPDVVAQTSRLEAAEQNERAARGGRWPSVSLSGSYSARYGSGSEGGFSEQLEEQQSGSVGLSVSLPLFDRQATGSAIERAQVSTGNVTIALAELRQDVALQVRRAVLDWKAAREELTVAEAQVLAAEQALAATEERYAVGVANLYEVTLSRADWISATSTRIRAQYNLLWQGRLLDYYVGTLDPTGDLWGAAEG